MNVLNLDLNEILYHQHSVVVNQKMVSVVLG